MISHVRIVLVNTSHPGNIGAAARAMKNMGLSRLFLVNPEQFPHAEATARASGADDILAQATITSDLPSALIGCTRVYATSARNRHLSLPAIHPRECAKRIVQYRDQEVAIVFGRERSGLTNEELAYCQSHITIPTHEDYRSLNLAAAVQIIVYEIYMTELSATRSSSNESLYQEVTHEQMNGFYRHLEEALVVLKFLNPKQPKMLMRRLKRLFNRAHPDETELNILRGILSAIEKKS